MPAGRRLQVGPPEKVAIADDAIAVAAANPVAKPVKRSEEQRVRGQGQLVAEEHPEVELPEQQEQADAGAATAKLLAGDEALVADAKSPAVYPSACLLYTSPSPRDRQKSRMPSSA